MADQAKLREQAARADEAARVYGSPLTQEFFTTIKEKIRGEWENTRAEDKEAREHQWQLYQAVGLLEACFKLTIATGKVALDHLKQQQEEAKPKENR